jgi:hypothetical protein
MPELHWSEPLWSEKFKDPDHPDYRITGLRTHPFWPSLCHEMTYAIHQKAELALNNQKHSDPEDWGREERRKEWARHEEQVEEDPTDPLWTEEELDDQIRLMVDARFYGILDSDGRMPDERAEYEGFTEWERLRYAYEIKWEGEGGDPACTGKGDERLITELLWSELVDEYAPVLDTIEKLLPPSVQEARREAGLTEDLHEVLGIPSPDGDED